MPGLTKEDFGALVEVSGIREMFEGMRRNLPAPCLELSAALWRVADRLGVRGGPFADKDLRELKRIVADADRRASVAEARLADALDPRSAWRSAKRLAAAEDGEILDAARKWRWWMDRTLGLLERARVGREGTDGRQFSGGRPHED